MTGASNAEIQNFTPDIESRRGEDLTREVASFVIDTTYDELPDDLLDLSRKSILDGLGLALSGSVAAGNSTTLSRTPANQYQTQFPG